jgi:predicted nuclease of restriction endonuclease-like (RecB) superfamily
MQIESAARARWQCGHQFRGALAAAEIRCPRAARKDPYIFEFLCLAESAQERDIERALTQHITRFLLELGAGVAFVGHQYRLEVGGDEFFVDLLFYHLTLRCYVVFELKTIPFKPEYAGHLHFYLPRSMRGSGRPRISRPSIRSRPSCAPTCQTALPGYRRVTLTLLSPADASAED